VTAPSLPGGIDPVDGETSYRLTDNKVPSGMAPSFPFEPLSPLVLGSGFLSFDLKLLNANSHLIYLVNYIEKLILLILYLVSVDMAIYLS
jgi:hypothetical protein